MGATEGHTGRSAFLVTLTIANEKTLAGVRHIAEDGGFHVVEAGGVDEEWSSRDPRAKLVARRSTPRPAPAHLLRLTVTGIPDPQILDRIRRLDGVKTVEALPVPRPANRAISRKR